MFVNAIFLCLVVLHVGPISSMDCEYSSREYQVALHPAILMPSFKSGITQILDELTKIERAQVLNFKVSVSSLQFKNVSVTEYVPHDDRDLNDFNVPLRFKSRQKKVNGVIDIVMKTSNADPELACWPLQIAADYVDFVKTKFELDVYAENGRILPKTAISYTLDLPLGFQQASPINISKYLVDSASKLSQSGQPIFIIPDSVGTVTMQTAEFDIRLEGEKFGATVFLIQRSSGLQSEFSFKIKDDKFNWQMLLAAQRLIAEMSRIRSIAVFAA